MNYTAMPGKWFYPCQNGHFIVSGDVNHWGLITAHTRGGGVYSHPLRRYVLADHVVPFGCFSFFRDVTNAPWDKYFSVPVPHTRTERSIFKNVCTSKALKTTLTLEPFTE